MKYKEMNKQQRQAYKAAKREYNFLVGGLENGLTDTIEGSTEWLEYAEQLQDRDGIIQSVYESVICEINNARFTKNIKFAGKEFILGIIAEMYDEDYNHDGQHS